MKKQRRIKLTKLEMKVEKSEQTTQKYKDHKRQLTRIIQQKMEGLEEMVKFLKTQITKTGEIEDLNREMSR